MEHELKQALYALNLAMGQTESSVDFHIVRSARDRVWNLGVRKYGWN